MSFSVQDGDETDPGWARGLFVPGGQFILDAPAEPPAIWGDGDQVLWAEGEPLLITGPTGVGKTTLVANVVLARIGVGPAAVLDLAVRPARRVLYLACDRPAQIARAFRRLVSPHDRARLDEALVVRKGPPPQDVAKHPRLLLDLARQADADCIVIDSLKDVAVKLSDDEVGAAVNQAHQHVVAAGLDLAALHHQRKPQSGQQPKNIEDVYGSTWIVAGAGSVVLLWGESGDPVVELRHLKQPAATVGPLVVEHDQAAGTVRLHGDTADPLTILRLAGDAGIVARAMAERLYGNPDPDRNDIRKARRRLDRLVTEGHAEKVPGRSGGDGGAEPDRYLPAANPESARQSKDHSGT